MSAAPTYRRGARREVASFVHRFGSYVGLAGAVVTIVAAIVTELQQTAPPEWAPWLGSAAAIVAACGTAVGVVRRFADEQPPPKRRRRTKTRPPPADAPPPPVVPLGWVKVPTLTRTPPKPRRQPRKAAPSRDDSRPDIPVRADYATAAKKAVATKAKQKRTRRRPPASEKGA